MKHNIRISTTEALLINKALRTDLHNDTDNKMAADLINKINDIVTFDLADHRCKECKFFNVSIFNRYCAVERRCMAKGNDNFQRFVKADKKACKIFTKEE